jgi:hypothetical protein
MYQTVDELKSAPGFGAVMARVSGGNNLNGANAVLAQAASRSQVDFDTLVWNKGDKFQIPVKEVLDAGLYGAKVGNGYSCGVVVGTTAGVFKQLPFSALSRSVSPFCYDPAKGGYVRTSDAPVQSNTILAKAARQCSNEKEVYDMLVANAGKWVEVKDVLECDTARQDWSIPARPVIGLRPAKVPCFDWAEK